MAINNYLFLYEVFKVQTCHISVTSGDEGIRTPDPLLARQVLSQLSYTPKGFYYLIKYFYLVGLRRLELPTSRLSGVRSNRLSYKPKNDFSFL